MAEDVIKWDCPRCTYKNFPVSRKCVLCHGPRPSRVISDLENSEQDIYKVAELEAWNKDVKEPGQKKPLDNGSGSKWSCLGCTYLNLPDLLKCSQCNLPQGFIPSPEKVEPGSSGVLKVTTEQPKALNINKGKTQSILKEARKVNARELTQLLKWTCQACTYLNQPRNKKCTMCSTPRDIQALLIDTESSGKKPELNELKIDVDLKNMENIGSNNTPAGQQRNNKSGQNSPGNKSNSPGPDNTGQNNKSGQISPGQSSPNNKSSPTSVHRTVSQEHCSSNGESFKQTSPKNNRSGQISPRNNRSGRNSPQSNLTAQVSPQGNVCGKISPPVVMQGSPYTGIRRSNRNYVRGRNEEDGAIGGFREEDKKERLLQRLRKKLTREDSIWLNACESVVKGDSSGIEIYLNSGGDPSRQLTKDEVQILDRPSAFEVGYTLVHLALRFRRDDMVAVLLAATDISAKAFKRLPSYTCPDLASAIRRDISVMLRQKKGTFTCYFLAEFCTFSLPADIEDLPRQIQTQLFEEILDTDVEKELMEEFVINWSLELTENLRSRLYALWNRTAGDCLLDSVLQATWGILDIDNTLRHALSDSLLEACQGFYRKWKDYETYQAQLMNFSLDEVQLEKDWTVLLSLASQPGASLEQLHIFALAHILRRPIIVYGVKVVKSFRGESIDFARFEGVYLPLMWDRSFCSKTPIALGYTRGHFSALVPMEVDTGIQLGAGALTDNAVDEQIFYLPLVDHEGAFLPLHFVTGTEQLGQEETILRRWLDCLVTQDGLFVAIQKVRERPPLVGQMIEGWLDHYRQEVHGTPCTQITTYSSDDESDQE